MRRNYISVLALLFWGFFCSFQSSGQNINLDSLEKVYSDNLFPEKQELTLLKTLSRYVQDPQKKLKYSELLQSRAKEKDSLQYVYDAVMQQGTSHRLTGDLTKALEAYLEASQIAQRYDSLRLFALSNITIGDVYSVMGNHQNSISYYNEGIQLLRKLGRESTDLASALLNAGDEYFNNDQYDSAMNFFYESSLLFKKLGSEIGSAYNLGNMGMVYAKQGKPQLAQANINEAISVLEEVEDYYAIPVYLNYMADIYLEEGTPNEALNYATRSLNIANKYQLKDEISKSHEMLSIIYEELNQLDKSLFHHREFVAYRDSINNLSNIQQLADLRTFFEISKKQIEVDLINEQKEDQRLISFVAAGMLLLVSILSYSLFRRNKSINKTRKVLEEERQKSNELLCNILPEETAAELKEKGHVKAKKYKNVTVLFSDFKGFTKYAEELPPEELVKTIDLYFSEFDRIMDKYNIEKIKTIGDAYMCASGLPVPDKKHAENMILAAKEMLDHVEKLKEVHAVDEPRFDIRIGIHSGPIVAGVVGKRKFAYDIWGDTVNAAARMESTAEIGKINVSETTYELLKDKYQFESRGVVEVKNRSSIKMYYLVD